MVVSKNRVKKEGRDFLMKCVGCQYEAPVRSFRYLYNARIDAPLSLRQCPKCMVWLSVDELHGEAKGIVKPGDAPWGKSTGIEGLAEDVLEKGRN
jgi:hypothetical protein